MQSQLEIAGFELGDADVNGPIGADRAGKRN